MRVLAIETAFDACSVALFEGRGMIAGDHRVLGRGHAEALVPMIAALPAKGRAGRIVVSLGPGSFTGVRIGLATARALGVAWGVPVAGYPTLALIASMARTGAGGQPLTVCMNGGHGQWFVQNFDAEGMPQDDPASLAPEQAEQAARHGVIAGNRARDLAARMQGRDPLAIEVSPDAAAVHGLDPRLLTDDLSLVYGRAPDATPLQQRIP